MEALISDIQYFCIHDGPGIRTTVFFVGCPLACAWCHNPECSVLAGKCIQPGSPIQGKKVAAADVVSEVMKDQPFYGNFGGITCSGGEPLAQRDAVAAVLEGCRFHGMTTAVETSLYAHWDSIHSLLPLVDYWIVDIKSMQRQAHLLYTGKSNELILENLSKLMRFAETVWIRMPVVPGVQAMEDIDLLADFLGNHPAIKRIELIPFHLLGSEKYKRFGMECPYPCDREPSQEEIDLFYHRLRSKGLPVSE